MKNIIQSAKNRIIKAGYVKNIRIRLTEPVITFTFDDASDSAFENGGAILSKYNFAATYYVALSFLENQKSDICFTREHLKRCLESGNELACHTFNHINFNEADSKKIKDELDKNAAELTRLFPEPQFKNFAYPLGEQTLSGKKLLRDRFKSARGITPGINRGKTDLNSLKAVPLYEDRNTPEYICQQITEAKESNGWLIFYTHDVQIHHSPFGCSPEYFESVVKKCFEENIRVMPVDQVLGLIEKNQTGYGVNKPEAVSLK